MPYQLDLGFLGVVFFVVLFFCPVLVLVVRRKWKLAAARQEEVMRLVLLASQEAARVEMESAIAYVSDFSAGVSVANSGNAIGGRQCVVCYSPTTTRCSRCKAIRYCSGKCQIIHWRLGHKEECYPPPVDDHCNGEVSVSNLKAVQAVRSDLSDKSLEIEGKTYATPVETCSKRSTSSESNCSEVFSEDDNLEDKPFVSTSGTESTSDSSSSTTFSGPVETSDYASAGEDLTRTASELFASVKFSGISPDSGGESLSCDGSSKTEVEVGDLDLMKLPPSECAFASFSVNSASCSFNLKQKASTRETEEVEGPSGINSSGSINCIYPELSESTSDCQDETVDSSTVQADGIGNLADSETCQEGDCIQLDAAPPLQMSGKLSGQIKPLTSSSRNQNSFCGASPLEGAVQFENGDATALGIEKPGCIGNGRSNDVWLLKSKEMRSLSSASAEYLSSSGKGHSLLSDTSSKVNNFHKVSPILPESTDSVPNGMSDLKTSVRRAVQQIKTSNSRHYPSGTSSYISTKYNYKMLFPYDLFVKLYNSDKVELRPCGLTNCGNSCYANAVLQCLAFTRPLTAYLLEGFHIKTCPKKEWCFTCEFESLLMKAKQGKSPLSPIGIISHIKNIGRNLGHGREEDAHEFLRYAIDAMQSACLKEARTNVVGPLAEETTLLQLIFGGYLRSLIKCMRCLGKSERCERMMDLTVEIHGDIGTLEEALARFTATEILDGENKYQCNRCKSYERAKKKLTILEAPNVLTITLKRYQSGKFGKLNKKVRFPEYLNLAPYMRETDDKSPVYRLYGVVVHLDIMNAAFSGHYVCYVKNTQGKWYKIDDSVVKPVELDRVLTKGAYMLLYARCSPRAPSLLRKAMSEDPENIKKSKCREAIPSGHDGDSRTSKGITSPNSSIARHRGSQDYPSWTADSVSSFESYEFFDERFRYPRANSSSDNSSLLSCSDEGSWSTESTRDSISTEEYSEYIFGESDRISRNSPLRLCKDSDGFIYSPLNSRHSSEAVLNKQMPNYFRDNLSPEEIPVVVDGDGQYSKLQGRGGVCFKGKKSPSILYTDRSEQCRKVTEQCSSRETDMKSSVLLRRSSKERTAQTFYL